MKSGDAILLPLSLRTAAGAALSYANLAAAQADGWSFSWETQAGASTTGPSLALSVDTLSGIHRIATTLPSSDLVLWIRHASNQADPYAFTLPGDSSDADSLAALIASTSSPVQIDTNPTTLAWEVVEGDSFARSVTIPASVISDMGWSDFTGVTLSGAVRTQGDTGTGSPLLAITAGTPGISASALVVSVSWNTWPAGLDLSSAERGNGSAVRAIDLQGKAGGKVKTIARGTLTIRRQEDRT